MVRVLINGVYMNYVRSGAGHPLLFVHGYTDSSEFWKPQVDFFARNYDAFAVDLVGHGKSDSRKDGYSIPNLCDDIYRFLRKMNIARTILLGHSMGGMIVQQFCVAHPDAVQALILCSTAASGRALKDAGGFDCIATLEEINKDGFERSVKNSVSYLFASTTSTEILNFTLSEELKTDVDAAVGCLKGMWGWNIQDQLSQIRVPTMIVVGEEDRATPPACSLSLKNSIVSSRIRTISNCGHMISVEKPQELNLIVKEFLDSPISLIK